VPRGPFWLRDVNPKVSDKVILFVSVSRFDFEPSVLYGHALRAASVSKRAEQTTRHPLIVALRKVNDAQAWVFPELPEDVVPPSDVVARKQSPTCSRATTERYEGEGERRTLRVRAGKVVRGGVASNGRSRHRQRKPSRIAKSLLANELDSSSCQIVHCASDLDASFRFQFL